MKVYTYERSWKLPVRRDEVFAFFQMPENLARITPPAMGFRILTPFPILMRAGALIDYTVRVLGLRMRWTTMITTYDPPMKFVDEQLKGPYSFWHHTHAFVEEDDGTRIVDTVRYALPFGAVGTLAHALVVRRQIRRIFEYREKVLAGLFEVNDAGGAHNADQSSGRSLTVEAQP